MSDAKVSARIEGGSAQGVIGAESVYIENLTSPRVLMGMMPERLFPGRAGVFVITHPSDMVDGRRVRFIERDPEVLTWYTDRPETRLAHLLVNPVAESGRP